MKNQIRRLGMSQREMGKEIMSKILVNTEGVT